jgi:hypothetical protein
MTTPLARFLSDAAARGFRWGEHDCMLFVANWALRLTGQDPGAPWRGTYSTEAEALGILHDGGGPGPILNGALIPQGWTARAGGCRAGDICVVRAPVRDGSLSLTASVHAGRGRFALVTERGLVVGPVPFLLGWSHPNNG